MELTARSPHIELIIPRGQMLLIGLGEHLLSPLTTFVSSRQAARIAHAEALRYE